MDLKYSKLQNKFKIKKFLKRINQELNAPPDFIFTLLLKWNTKTCSTPLVFTKLHPFYHLKSTQPDHAMWQSPPFQISQPKQATCHNPPLTKLTSQILPRHHLLHRTHETLTLIFILFHYHQLRQLQLHHARTSRYGEQPSPSATAAARFHTPCSHDHREFFFLRVPRHHSSTCKGNTIAAATFFVAAEQISTIFIQELQ